MQKGMMMREKKQIRMILRQKSMTVRQRRTPEERKATGITERRNGRKKEKLCGEPLNTVPRLQSPPEE